MTVKKLFFDEQEPEYIYGDRLNNLIALNPRTFPRYAPLARKVLSHYLGNKYDPVTFDVLHEIFIRQLIHSFVEAKVVYKLKGYDWEFIDNLFKKVISEALNIEISYNAERLEQGIRPEFRVNNLHKGNETLN